MVARDAFQFIFPRLSRFHFFPGILVAKHPAHHIASRIKGRIAWLPLLIRRIVTLVTEEFKDHDGCLLDFQHTSD